MTVIRHREESKIDGNTGPYSKKNQSGRSANAGYQVAHSLLLGINQLRSGQSIVYTNAYYGNGPNPLSINANAGLAYSTEALKKYDQNKNGTVSVDELANSFRPNVPRGVEVMESKEAVQKRLNQAKALDLNADGKIDSGEYLAYTMYQDGQKQIYTFQAGGPNSMLGTIDGKVTAEEARLANENLVNNPNAVKAQLQKLYDNNNIAVAQQNFKMPKKLKRRPQSSMEWLFNLLQQFLGKSGNNKITLGAWGVGSPVPEGSMS